MRPFKFLAGALAVTAMMAGGVGALGGAAGAAPLAPAHGHSSWARTSEHRGGERGDHSARTTVTGVVSSLSSSGFDLSVSLRGERSGGWAWGTGAKGAGTTTLPTVRVAVGTSTRYVQPGVSSPSVANGEFVEVAGTKAADGTIDATLVRIPDLALQGTVSATGASSITLTGTSTTLSELGLMPQLTATAYVVDISAATRLDEPGIASPSLAAIVNGDIVRVAGAQSGADQSGNSTLAARRVVLPELAAVGSVDQVGASSFTLVPERETLGTGEDAGIPRWSDHRGGPKAGSVSSSLSELTVQVTSSTKFAGGGIAGTGLASLQHGQLVSVSGVQAGASTVSALRVIGLRSGHSKGDDANAHSKSHGDGHGHGQDHGHGHGHGH